MLLVTDWDGAHEQMTNKRRFIEFIEVKTTVFHQYNEAYSARHPILERPNAIQGN